MFDLACRSSGGCVVSVVLQVWRWLVVLAPLRVCVSSTCLMLDVCLCVSAGLCSSSVLVWSRSRAAVMNTYKVPAGPAHQPPRVRMFTCPLRQPTIQALRAQNRHLLPALPVLPALPALPALPTCAACLSACLFTCFCQLGLVCCLVSIVPCARAWVFYSVLSPRAPTCCCVPIRVGRRCRRHRHFSRTRSQL